MIEVINRQRLISVDAQLIRELAAAAVRIAAPLQGINPDSSLSVAFVRDPAIRKLNRDYRGKDRETDVLSFPANEVDSDAEPELEAEPEAELADDPDGGKYLGDIVISTDTAIRQSRQSGLKIEREILELVLHGVLHLCGYDHEADRGEMNRLELRLRRQLLDAAASSRKRRSSS